MVYLLHFERRVNGQRHYVGWTRDLERRLVEHALGAGAVLTHEALANGIRFVPTVIWVRCTAEDEDALQGAVRANPRLCPLCDLHARGRTGEATALARERLAYLSGLVQDLRFYEDGVLLDKDELDLRAEIDAESWWNLQVGDWGDNLPYDPSGV